MIDELDRQKYRQGDLARRAATAIHYLEDLLRDRLPGEPVQLRDDAVLEVWVNTEDRGVDADLAILRCAADLANLHSDVRVLTNDTCMRLRAQHMGLKPMRLPGRYRKPDTALDDAPAERAAP